MTVCAECEDHQRVEYGRTDAGKASYKRLQDKKMADPGYRAWLKEYWASDAGQAALDRYAGSDKNTARQARASAKERGKHGIGTLTGEEWREIVTRYQSTCAYCRKRCREDVRPTDHNFLTMDHVLSLKRGGTHTKENVVPACMTCNARKGRKRRIPLPPPA